MKIIIHGGGYVGLVGAVHMALKNLEVVIYDPDQKTVNSINSGEPRAGEYLGYINEDVKQLVSKGNLKATTCFEDVISQSIHLVAVPTEKGDSPDMSIVKGVITRLERSIPKDGIVIVESTIQPGTIDQIYLPRVMKKEIYLAVCPRLDWFADRNKNVTNLPRIIGGYNKESTRLASSILSLICNRIEETGYREAEFAKSGQNDLYFTLIERAHEIAFLAHDKADMNEVLRLISLHWRIPEVYLGPGVSGRCIQMGAQYLRDSIADYAPINESALSMNEMWKDAISTRLVKNLPVADQTSSILIMGIAYRPNFSDFGYSAGLTIAKNLHNYSWNVFIDDPILSSDTLNALILPRGSILDKPDVILLATGHDDYKGVPHFINKWGKRGQFILDACGLWEKHRLLFKEHAIKYIRVGEQGWLTK